MNLIRKNVCVFVCLYCTCARMWWVHGHVCGVCMWCMCIWCVCIWCVCMWCSHMGLGVHMGGGGADAGVGVCIWCSHMGLGVHMGVGVQMRCGCVHVVFQLMRCGCVQ